MFYGFFCAARFVRRLKDKKGYSKFFFCKFYSIGRMIYFGRFDANKQACVVSEEKGLCECN